MTESRTPGEPGSAHVDDDLLAAFLKLAQQEGALEGEDLAAFAAGLRERAERVIAERVGRAETSLRVLETESTASVNSLEREKAWLRETIGNLEAEATRRQSAHESLLAHHRELMTRLAGQLGEIASLSAFRPHEVRRRLRALADLLRADTL